ncbi:unnamed protein product [Aphanomyces euteiches]|uniref:Putative auto-transporter adhesin head GIN domain-containing protein n=1 Tax=Aphanomyces euteiches TaxID=100861 RepID=A0A6G0XBW7_9STRA|nr:hypothetical protein Ae201684_006671 [Aphanomyces euteiches]KAH9091004.1 hypothetical protein Ae201684P_006405 [Aphanomyces euteiches]KAH9148804.1 hypothetical protein AeRB84_007989 [Aphanomyces euteiches]
MSTISTSWPQFIFNATRGDVRGLVLNNAGAFVYTTDSATTPSVVLRASNSNLLRALAIHIRDTDVFPVMELVFPSTADGDYVLEVYVPTQSLQYLLTAQAGDTSIAAEVFTNDATVEVKMQATGSGSILVQGGSIQANDLVVEALGSGRVEIDVQSLFTMSSIDLATNSSGSVALYSASTTTSKLTAATSSSGNVFVGRGASTKPNFQAMTVSAHVSGQGDVVMLYAGTCGSSEIQTSGVGTAYLGALACRDSKTVLLGDGDIYVVASSSLQSQDSGKGTVYAALQPGALIAGPFSAMPNATVLLPQFTPVAIPDHQTFKNGRHSTMTTGQFACTILSLLVFAGTITGLAMWAFWAVRRRRRSAKEGQEKFTEISTPTSETTMVAKM